MPYINKENALILSIESSCDDSSIALTRISDYKILFHQKISQDINHAKYGGVVPEIASRLHCVHLPKILQNISDKFDLARIKAIAVTNEPGLSVSLLEGVMMAKALSLSLQIPLIAVNHLQGHIYSLFLEKEATFPICILLLSGGHSLILEAKNHSEIKIIASTLDDSFGEAFDKVAKMLSLGYPGGVAVESNAKLATKKHINFTIPLRNNTLAFSFSGLKNAVRLKIEELGEEVNVSEICYAFQKTAISHILQKMRIYFSGDSNKIASFGVVGGASANLALRGELERLAGEFGKKILFAPLEFCSDNAAMIGRSSVESYKSGDFISLENLTISPKTTRF